ncbi:pyrroline-5-carboxylate reductase (plasmid) [Pseudosulfitobacter pseudonitzschiae]|uniref:Pyrroline-5-carboxylate reductase n=2 Tax=Rhodobacterales TaxID=204455 RepID=A0A221K7Q8_9RHOB|nr:pyrroline-5-carboxylate reductase [Pseudosulfitobacter pseudonitzschiae]
MARRVSVVGHLGGPLMRVGVLGLGTIASALVEGIAEDGHSITVSTRSAGNAARLSERFDTVTVADNQAVVDSCEILFLGLTDPVYRDVLSGLAFRADQRVISLMAGPNMHELAGLVAPAKLVARMIPFPSIAIGGSQILALGDSSAIQALFGARNWIFELDTEAELQNWLCAQAVLSPAVLMVKEAADWLVQQGSEYEKAEQFLRELVASSLSARPCEPLLRALDTPGGYNQRLRQKMVSEGLSDSLSNGLTRLNT